MCTNDQKPATGAVLRAHPIAPNVTGNVTENVSGLKVNVHFV